MTTALAETATPCSKCGQPHRHCGAHNREGSPCGRMAMKHLTVCDRHGGKAPSARRSADKHSIAAMFETNPLATYIAAESNLKRLIVMLTVELGRYTEMLNRMEGAASRDAEDPDDAPAGVDKRCGCRDEDGRQYTSYRPCPLIGNPDHGTWGFRISNGNVTDETGKRKRSYLNASGYASMSEAIAAREEAMRKRDERISNERASRIDAQIDRASIDPDLARKAAIYDDLKALGLLEQMGITE